MSNEDLKKRIKNEIGTSYFLIILGIQLLGVILYYISPNLVIIDTLLAIFSPIIGAFCLINLKFKETKKVVTPENFNYIKKTLIEMLLLVIFIGYLLTVGTANGLTRTIVLTSFVIGSLIVYFYIKPKSE